MKKYRIKRNKATTIVLPFMLLVFAILVVLAFIVPETTLLTCKEIETSLYNEHNKVAYDMSDSLHNEYHLRLDECINKGYIAKYPQDDL